MAKTIDHQFTLSQLLAEVDKLENELKDLIREAQRGGNVVQQLEEIVARDVKYVEDTERYCQDQPGDSRVGIKGEIPHRSCQFRNPILPASDPDGNTGQEQVRGGEDGHLPAQGET